MPKFTNEERENMVIFIKRTYGDKVREDEINTDEKLEKVYNEAYSYSEWGM